MKKCSQCENAYAQIALLLVALLFLFAGPSSAQFSKDAIILTLRHQEGIRFDSTLAAEIDAGLAAARTEIDTLNSIHAFCDYAPNELLVSTDASWNQAWQRKEILTGESYIDSLGLEYGLIEVRPHRFLDLYYFVLTFATLLEMRQLSEHYQQHPEVKYADPNFFWGGGDNGDNIEYLKKNEVHHFAFSHGWGDCPSGCGERYYWYVSVVSGDTGYVAHLEEEKYRDFCQAYIYRWNIPNRYAMTSFDHVDSIFQSIRHAPEWWIRRHAIEGIWRLFVHESPWVGEDCSEEAFYHWHKLKEELASRIPELRGILEEAVSDSDPDVSASAEYALDKIVLLSIREEATQPAVFALYPNYPNPFNPSTTIPYRLPRGMKASIILYNTFGQKVIALVDQYKEAGYHRMEWDGTDAANNSVSSGVYFCRMTTEAGTITKRMVFLK
ncbi:MAG: T9SS type A sorting domain-containing protein [Candidatus Latescibacteria bacterium]|nr:T9SS type A sorting domain-containing protein [Candidatus Latescibacterota bacterium]